MYYIMVCLKTKLVTLVQHNESSTDVGNPTMAKAEWETLRP